jgi:NADPH:quinone reductase-like Zn-dependent oxidoreductase
MGSMLGRPNQKDYTFLIELFETGKVVPVIDRCYPLSEVPKALRYYGEGNARGKVVITVENNSRVDA